MSHEVGKLKIEQETALSRTPFVIVDLVFDASELHIYCRPCRDEIPEWLIAAERPGPVGNAHPDWDACENCGKERQPHYVEYHAPPAEGGNQGLPDSRPGQSSIPRLEG